MRAITVVFAILLASCTQTKVVEHQTAVPVEKLVYLPIDWSKFQECPPAPQALIAGKTNADMFSMLNAALLRAQCLADEIDQVKGLK